MLYVNWIIIQGYISIEEYAIYFKYIVDKHMIVRCEHEFLINRLDNLFIDSESFEFIPENIKKINMNGMIVGAMVSFWLNKRI